MMKSVDEDSDSDIDDRHKLNQQTELLKVQNCELRRLLHTYMMTGSKKTQKPDREFVPPHARRRMVTHMLLFDEP
uniref:Uncharacterized protein n=1 Tax=Timema poppense TaxID=170557 RepID=A0A7R9GW04_TIMPO|nr:unnamed protein product [Timema poppensis]